MKNALIRKPLALVAAASLALPALGMADCIPSEPALTPGVIGYDLPFQMVSLESNKAKSPYASYAVGSLDYTAHDIELFDGKTLSGTGSEQLFSDRTYCRSTGLLDCNPQPFNVDAADKLGIGISDGETLLIIPPSGEQIIVTFTLESWGDAKQSFTAICDATSGTLRFSSATQSYIMSFGTPVPILAPPK